MSISTPSGEQKSPSSVKVSAKPGGKPGTKTGAKPATQGKGKGSGPRRPITPVKVNQGRNWGPIALFTAVGVLAVGIMGWAAWAAFRPGGPGYGWESRAKSIPGVQDFRGENISRSHVWGEVKYSHTPPIGGDHIYPPVWQRCMGDIYDSEIPNEHAVHSLEHGAVWVTYKAGLPADQIKILEDKVRNKPYTMLSPYEGLDKNVSLQAWGWQLKVDDVNDPRIADFIGSLAKNATAEPGATCSGGTTAMGKTPFTEEQAQRLSGGGA